MKVQARDGVRRSRGVTLAIVAEKDQGSGFMASFKHEHYLGSGLLEFPVTWEDLFLFLNLQSLDVSIVRCSALLSYQRVKANGSKIVFVDPMLASEQCMK